MSIWRRLFGSRSDDDHGPNGPSRRHRESDNRGTRQDTLSHASSYWMARNVNQKFEPYALYVFDLEQSAREALLGLPCMQLAHDTGKVICTETLTFGYYRTEEGKYEAIVCGNDLSREVWASARASFLEHGGVRKNEQEPSDGPKAVAASRSGDARQVRFIREDRRERMGQQMIYRVHQGPDAESAKAFLHDHPVTKNFCYVIVETPDGNYCRDIDGIYKE